MNERLYAWRHGWRWSGWFFRRGKVVAGLRELFDAYVRGHNGETLEDLRSALRDALVEG